MTEFSERYGPWAVDVAAAALDHLGDGPTWMCGSADPLGPPPFGTLTRREAVLRVSHGR